MNEYEGSVYTLKVNLAQEFETEADALLECEEDALSCFRIGKIYVHVLEY